MKFLLLCTIFAYSMSLQASGLVKSLEDDSAKIAEYQERCENINSLIVKKSFKLSCYTNYNHYGPTSKSLRQTTSLKIANYNLLHPGTSKALFKDYFLIAKIMNQFDVIAGLELLATVGRDEKNNKDVLVFIETSLSELEKTKMENEKSLDLSKSHLLEQRIKKLSNDIEEAKNLYRSPGYFKVLLELKKLDPSWSLLLSPRGDSAQEGSVEELAGFFYRANVASPVVNPHCKEYAGEGAGTAFACFITLTKDFMGKDLVQHFSRRPFMASFKTNTTTYTLVTSHVVFTYSGDEDAHKDLLQKTFGTNDYKTLGPGINSTNFARYAEVKNTLDFMNKYRTKYNDKKIMFLSDTNLVSDNLFWPEVLKAFPGSELLITDPTTVSPVRYRGDGTETNGEANDYDHYFLDKKEFKTCDNGEVYNYFNEKIYNDIENTYIIRKEVVGVTTKLRNFQNKLFSDDDLSGDIPAPDEQTPIKLDYPLTPKGQSKKDKLVSSFKKNLLLLKTVKDGKIVFDDFQIEERIVGMDRRVFLRQLTNPFYHRFMQELLSDHFPVALTCKF